MHDLDRTLGRNSLESGSLFDLNTEAESEQYAEQESFEYTGEESSGVFNEEEVSELAAELLSVSNNEELNQFLGNLISKAGSALGKVIKSPIGQQVGSWLKTAAGRALPIAGAALGNVIAPGAGGAIGGKLGSLAGQMFGLEMEGLSHEDRQYEIAKQFVRFGGDATKKAVALSAAGIPPANAAKTAVQHAAERYVPGLVNGVSPRPSAAGGRGSPAQRGHWTRQGQKIVIHLGKE